MAHESVLLQPSIEGLAIAPGDVFVDATINGGGHSEYVAKKHGAAVEIVGIDMDEDALARSRERLRAAGAVFTLRQANFSELSRVLQEIGKPTVQRILFDLGISSDQYESGRGFSFMRDEPLVMTFKKDITAEDTTASEILNAWEEEHIADIIWGYGEERYARRIARAIAEYRKAKPIEYTGELVEIIKSAVPPAYRHGKIHYATRTFQALRIAVNNELERLKSALPQAWGALSPKGRMAIISFHSLEDRIVKHFFKERHEAKEGTIITKKPIVPSEEEVTQNRRSRSAKLRIIEKK